MSLWEAVAINTGICRSCSYLLKLIVSSRQSPTNMCSLSTFVLLFAITTTLAFASPISKRQSGNGGMMVHNYKCYALPKKVSDNCGYNTTVLPNTRGHKTVEEALSEFQDFAPLLTDSSCSDDARVLLCFHYFPFLNCTPEQDVSDNQSITRPCNDICVAVTESESCTTHVNATTGTGWPHNLTCSTEESFPRSGVCSGLNATISKNYTVQLPSTTVSLPEVTTPSTTPKPEVTSPTEAPTTKRQSCNGVIAYDKCCKCHALPKEVSEYCGHSTTVLPNARGHTTVYEALSEFDDFARLLTNSPCSDQLGVLLCFHYFPFGSCTPDTVVECENGVTPCKDTCEAAKSESCTALLLNSQMVSGWANHLGCERFPIYIPAEARHDKLYRVCVNSTATIRRNFTKAASSVVTTKVLSTSTTPKAEATTPTEAPTTKGTNKQSLH